MAAPSQLEGRVRAVLEARRDRRGVTRRTGAVCAGAVLLATLPLAAVSPSERAAPARPEVAWELPPARSAPPSATRERTRTPRPSTDAASAPGIRIAMSVQRAPRPAPTPAPAPGAAKPDARTAATSASSSPRPALLASIDEDGGVHVNLKALHQARAGRPLRVRVAAGHGATSTATMDIRVDPALQAMIAAVVSDAPPPRTHLRQPGMMKKFDAVVNAAAGGGNELAVRVLDELHAGLARSASNANTPETGGGA
jgi:hypothetical protein